MKIKVDVKKGKEETQSGKRVKINESTRKDTLSIYDRVVHMLKSCWGNDVQVETAAQQIAGIFDGQRKKEIKEAIDMILEDDMDVFKNERKIFRVYAQKVLKAAKNLAKERREENKDAIKRIVKRSEKMEAVMAKPDIEHPFGTGKRRIENELRHRPRFLMEDIKFKVFRKLGIY